MSLSRRMVVVDAYYTYYRLGLRYLQGKDFEPMPISGMCKKDLSFMLADYSTNSCKSPHELVCVCMAHLDLPPKRHYLAQSSAAKNHPDYANLNHMWPILCAVLIYNWQISQPRFTCKTGFTSPKSVEQILKKRAGAICPM